MTVDDRPGGAAQFKRKGAELRGPCPVTRQGRDRCWIQPDHDPPLIGCRGCGDAGGRLEPDQFRAHVDALPPGLWPEPARPARTPDQRWTCVAPIEGGEYVHVRYVDRDGEKAYKWEPTGAVRGKTRRLAYPARVVVGADTMIVCEGEKAADACARLVPDATVIGTCQGAPRHPDADVLTHYANGGHVVVWPDNDSTGREMAANVRRILPDAAVVDPAALGLTADGADAADFRPSDSVDVLAAVLEAAEHEKPNGRAGGDRAGPRDGDRDGDRDGVSPPHRIWRAWDALEGESGPPETVLPGLAWRGEFTLLVGDSKAGKTTLIAHALGAALRGESFLGEVPNVGGRIAYMSEMTPQRTKGWIAAHGVEWADVDFLPPVGFVQLVEYLEERKPALLIVDTLIAFGTAARSDENSANDMRALANVLLGSGTTCLASHHSMKHDPNTYRGSGDVRAAVGMAITMTGVDGGAPTDRQLRYLGRWNVGDDDRLVLRFNRETKTYHADAADDTTGRIVHAVRSEEGCTRYQALKLAGLPKGGRGYAAINAAIADALLVVGNQGELFTADAWRSMQGEQREAAR